MASTGPGYLPAPGYSTARYHTSTPPGTPTPVFSDPADGALGSEA